VDVTMQFTVPRDEKGAKEFVQASILGWFNKNADRPEAPYVIVIPEKGIVPQFGKADGSAPGESSSSAAGARTEEVEEEAQAPSQDSGAGAMNGRNRSDTVIVRKRAALGGSSGFAEKPDDDGTGDGAGGGSAAGGARRDRKAGARVAVKSGASDPVDLDRDARIPEAPRAFGAGPATTVTIKFTVELRAPVGRDMAPAAGAAEGEEPTEGEQQ
jgi:hypothetical protein